MIFGGKFDTYWLTFIHCCHHIITYKFYFVCANFMYIWMHSILNWHRGSGEKKHQNQKGKFSQSRNIKDERSNIWHPHGKTPSSCLIKIWQCIKNILTTNRIYIKNGIYFMHKAVLIIVPNVESRLAEFQQNNENKCNRINFSYFFKSNRRRFNEANVWAWWGCSFLYLSSVCVCVCVMRFI